MAEISTVARPYAQAAFDVACSEDKLAEWAQFLSSISVVASHVEVRELIENPQTSSAQVASLFEASVSPLTESMSNFLNVIAFEKRVSVLSAVHVDFCLRKNNFEGSADAYLVSAYVMTDIEIADLMVLLEKKFNVKLNPIVSVDESLIGGFCVTVGDEVLDMSVRTSLGHMKIMLVA